MSATYDKSSIPWDRFLTKFEIGAPDECWEWKAGRTSGGYGNMGTVNPRRNWQAHRLSYIHFKGTIPDGFCVCHTCDNRGCVNPYHLFLGTSQENTADRNRKSRQARGSKQGSSKLTKDQVLEIYSRYKAGGVRQRDLGREFGVSQAAISFITRGLHWQHVTIQP